MNDIKPIQTKYNGYLFRSRLEARWAVFFDGMGINYEYEPEGYEISNCDKYLPDFFLPDCCTYVEVKSLGAIKIDFDNGKAHFQDGREPANKYAQFAKRVPFEWNYLIVQGDPYDALGMCDPENNKQEAMARVFYKPAIIWRQTLFTELGVKHDNLNLPYSSLVGCFVNKQPFIVISCLDDLVVPKDHTVTMAFDNVSSFTTIGCNDRDIQIGLEDTRRSALIARQARFEHGEEGVNHG